MVRFAPPPLLPRALSIIFSGMAVGMVVASSIRFHARTALLQIDGASPARIGLVCHPEASHKIT
ncbi:hypothetical protein L810_5598 [Burkholderia sp. AU4i]|nr:hypothetical protein L810_5598 [Burkholderia sp. AU4i]